jgi:hypothetical protein
METITLRRDDARDLRFVGELVAEATDRGRGPDERQRWRELSLYRTAGGKLVCADVRRSVWQNEGEHDRFSVHIADDEAGIVDALGCGWLAKQLFSASGIHAVEELS